MTSPPVTATAHFQRRHPHDRSSEFHESPVELNRVDAVAATARQMKLGRIDSKEFALAHAPSLTPKPDEPRCRPTNSEPYHSGDRLTGASLSHCSSSANPNEPPVDAPVARSTRNGCQSSSIGLHANPVRLVASTRISSNPSNESRRVCQRTPSGPRRMNAKPRRFTTNPSGATTVHASSIASATRSHASVSGSTDHKQPSESTKTRRPSGCDNTVLRRPKPGAKLPTHARPSERSNSTTKPSRPSLPHSLGNGRAGGP